MFLYLFLDNACRVNRPCFHGEVIEYRTMDVVFLLWIFWTCLGSSCIMYSKNYNSQELSPRPSWVFPPWRFQCYGESIMGSKSIKIAISGILLPFYSRPWAQIVATFSFCDFCDLLCSRLFLNPVTVMSVRLLSTLLKRRRKSIRGMVYVYSTFLCFDNYSALMYCNGFSLDCLYFF